MWSASRPCPHASWKRIPPLPDSRMSGTSPLGAGRAVSFTRARRAAAAAMSRTSTVSNSSKPTVKAARLVPGLHAGVADGHARHAEARAHLVVGDEDAVAVGDLDAPPAVAVGRRHLRDGAAAGARRVVGLDQELDLAGLGDVLGEHGHVVALHRLAPLERRPRASASLRGPPPRPPRPRPAGRARRDRRCGRSRSSRPPRPGPRRRGRGPMRAPRPGRRRARPRSSGGPPRRPRRSPRRAGARRRAPAR